MSDIRFRSFPSTMPPPDFVRDVVRAFEEHSEAIGPAAEGKRFGSDKVLAVLRPALKALGFEVEEKGDSPHAIHRPVFFGENGAPSLRYRVDAYHSD